MLRITQQNSAAQAKNYYKQSDYYQDGPNALKGHWHGIGAARLGLAGEVDQNQFDRIVDNLHPNDPGQSLTPRTRKNRRIGWDLTFNVPKSVSIAWGITQDEKILDAVYEAVRETLDDIERDVLTRVHVGKKMHTEKSSNLIAATWMHTTSRPVDGLPMPHLHVHAWVANATHHRGRFKAMDISAIKKDAPYFEALFHSRLAEKLQHSIHVAVERQGKKWFEIKGFPRTVVMEYSKRLQQVEEEAKRRGITDAKQKAELGAKTRQAKSKAIPAGALPKAWAEMLGVEETEQIERDIQDAAALRRHRIRPEDAFRHAVEHHFATKTAERERKLKTEALWRGVGDVGAAEIEAQFASSDLIRNGTGSEAIVTTKHILGEERAMLAFARDGVGAERAMAENATIQRDWLSPEQVTAVKRIWNSRDRTVIVAGKAGTGKTTLAQEAVSGLEKSGRQVTMLAPTTKAVEVLARDGFRPNTLARFLKDHELQADASGGVVWLDEAGLVSQMEMIKLFRIAEAHSIRLVLAGDAKQHASIGRGQPLKFLEEEAGIRPIRLSKIRRQQDRDYRRAVEYLSEGQVTKGLEVFSEMGAIVELSGESRHRQLAAEYIDALEEGESALIVSPSNAEKRQLTKVVRDELKERGFIGGNEHRINTLRPYGWSEAEKSDSAMYSKGDVIEFHAKGKRGFRPGERAEVTDVVEGRVFVQVGGRGKELPLTSAGAFSVYQPVEQAFARGDLIRLTRNRRGKPGQQRLTNGRSYIIQGFSPDGDLRLGNGLTLRPEWGHFDHGRVSTSFLSQGETKDRVFIAQGTDSLPASSAEQLYVSASRARKGLRLFVEDVQALRDAVTRERGEMTATSLLRRTQKPFSRLKQQVERLRHVGEQIHEFFREHLRRSQPSQMVPKTAAQPMR